MPMVIQATVAGLGIAVMPEFLCNKSWIPARWSFPSTIAWQALTRITWFIRRRNVIFRRLNHFESGCWRRWRAANVRADNVPTRS